MFDLKPHYNKILVMNDLVGNSIQNEKMLTLYSDLTFEETGEILEAIENKERLSIEECKDLFLDGVIDSMVVGFFLNAAKNNIESVNNLQLEYSLLSKEKIFLNIQKIKAILLQYESAKIIEKKGTLHFNINIIKDNIESILKSVQDIAYSLQIEFGFDIEGAFKEVMNSNFTKFPLVGTIDPEKEVLFIESAGRYKNVTYKTKVDLEGNNRVIFYSDKGKFVKPSCFKEPKLSPFLPKTSELIEYLQYNL